MPLGRIIQSCVASTQATVVVYPCLLLMERKKLINIPEIATLWGSWSTAGSVKPSIKSLVYMFLTTQSISLDFQGISWPQTWYSASSRWHKFDWRLFQIFRILTMHKVTGRWHVIRVWHHLFTYLDNVHAITTSPNTLTFWQGRTKKSLVLVNIWMLNPRNSVLYCFSC